MRTGDVPGAQHCDLLIVGAGPAGMAAAIAACEYGLRVVLADEASCPGGQIYRQAGESPLADTTPLGAEYAAGVRWVKRFLDCGAYYLPQTVVWQIEPPTSGCQPHRISLTQRAALPHRAAQWHADAVLIATGAQERPWPVRNWTLPGVMGVGAAQTLMKAGGLVPGEDTVLAGSGPLLWHFASQLLEAGQRVQAIVDTTPAAAYLDAVVHLPRALRNRAELSRGLQRMRNVRRQGIPVYRHAFELEIIGEQHAQRLSFRTRLAPYLRKTLDSTLILLHQGMIPATNLSRSMGVGHRWNDAQACWEPCTDMWGMTDVQRTWIAGDGARIAGAQVAQCAGQLAALDIAAALGWITDGVRERDGARVRRDAALHVALRPLLDALYTPPRAQRIPADADVIVCRCEEVRAGEIGEIAAAGCPGPDQLKALSRCGMGPCQGRWCGPMVSEMLAQAQTRDIAQVGYYRIRAPVKPVTVAEIAQAVPTGGAFACVDFSS